MITGWGYCCSCIYPEERPIAIIGSCYRNRWQYPEECRIVTIGWGYCCSCVYPEERLIAIIGSCYGSRWQYPEERPIVIIEATAVALYSLKCVPLLSLAQIWLSWSVFIKTHWLSSVNFWYQSRKCDNHFVSAAARDDVTALVTPTL